MATTITCRKCGRDLTSARSIREASLNGGYGALSPGCLHRRDRAVRGLPGHRLVHLQSRPARAPLLPPRRAPAPQPVREPVAIARPVDPLATIPNAYAA